MNIKYFFRRLFGKGKSGEEETNTDKMKYLIACLGNIGSEYSGTRHNIGFMVADHLTDTASSPFTDSRYGFVSKFRFKNAELVVLKPSTYMNLSGNAVRYWLQKEKITPDRLLVVCDDISLPLGKLRMRAQGSAGGHNGLKHIACVLGGENYARLKVGVGNDFPKGSQIDFVLGKFSDEELTTLKPCIEKAADAVKTFCLSGITTAMNQFNKG